MKLVIALILSVSISAMAQEITFYGNATDLKSGELLYREVHNLTIDDAGNPVSETVEYLDPQGQQLGYKRLDYQNLSSPNYIADYKYLDTTEIVTKQNSSLIIERGDTVSLSLPTTNYVIDGGFHYLMLKNFNQLINEDPIQFQFLSAGRADFIPLKAKSQKDGDKVRIDLSLDNFFLSKLVKPIELVYDINTQNLLSYRGLTNVPSATGKLYSAQIDYLYPADYAQNSFTLPNNGRL